MPAKLPIRSPNPFKFARAIDASSIADREQELRRLSDVIRNGERLFLIGPAASVRLRC